MNTPNPQGNDMSSQMPLPEDCVLPVMLDRRAAERPDEPFVLFDPEGDSWTFAETRRQGRRMAAALSRLGVRRGDRVVVWLPNSRDILRIHLGTGYLGAVFVPVNIAYRGASLEHVIRDSGADLMICHSDLVGRIIEETELSKLTKMVIIGGDETCVAKIEQFREDVLRCEDEDFPEPVPALQPWDVHCICYTSGTTGLSKGVLCTHLHTTVLGRTNLKFCGQDDRFCLNLAYFHLAGPLILLGTLAVGMSFVMQRAFQTKTFWDDLRRTGSTCTYLMGSMSTFLLKQPPREDDRDNPLRYVWQQPLSHDHAEFSRRFGVTIYTQIDMTETTAAVGSGPIPTDRTMGTGYVGRLRETWPRYEARLVDENDCEVPVGKVGELVVRCDVPWVITPGYHERPDATAAAWRNGWFHTGDMLRLDENGDYYFVDRNKDSIRRRGENISSAELETEVLCHASVADAAAVAVKNELDDEEVLLIVSPSANSTIDVLELTNHLIARVPHYMVPRYVRVVPQMPYSDTNKIQKAKLREQGITADTWDREAAGIKVKRELIGAGSA